MFGSASRKTATYKPSELIWKYKQNCKIGLVIIHTKKMNRKNSKRNSTKVEQQCKENPHETADVPMNPPELTTKAMLQEILSAINELKEQNEHFKEETKKEIADLKTEIQKRDETWKNDRENIQNKLDKVESCLEEKITNFDNRLREIERSEELRRRRERRNNIIIKSKTIAEKKEKLEDEVKEIFKKLEVDVSYEHMHHIGEDWKKRGLALVRLNKLEDKMKIMRNKRKLGN